MNGGAAMTIWRMVTASVGSLALCSCAAMDSLHWSFPGPGDSQVVSVDAKQRHLLIANYGKEGAPQIRACAEPAPDTFAAYSTSLLGLLGLAADKRDVQASVAAGETVASLERTQTVNLLREMLYRTCERWLSGALDQEQFLSLSARDHRSMIAVLAIEQLTGVVKPPSTIISGPAVSAAIGQSKELVKLLTVYQEERAVAEKSETKASTDYDKVNEEVTANGGQVRVCTLADPPPADVKAKWDKCKAAADAKKAAKDVAVAARGREESVLDQLEALAGGIGSAVKPGQQANPPGGQGDNGKPTPPTGDDLEFLAQTVRDIVLTPGIDEALMFCIGYLNKVPDKTATDTRVACNQIVTTRAAQDLQQRGYFLTGDTAAFGGPGAMDGLPSLLQKGEYLRSNLLTLIANSTNDAEAVAGFARAKASLGIAANDLKCTSRSTCTRVIQDNANLIDQHVVRHSREDLKRALNSYSGVP